LSNIVAMIGAGRLCAPAVGWKWMTARQAWATDDGNPCLESSCYQETYSLRLLRCRVR
jgi:hypothetical protein